MAFTTQGGHARGSTRQRYRLMGEINVTPFVDVMLVLLVVFMVTAPLLTVGVTVDLPKTAAPAVAGQEEPLAISVNGKGQIFLQETEVQLDELVPRLRAVTARKPDQRIFIRADQTIAYGRVMEVMGTITSAGFNKVALIADPQATVTQQSRDRNRSRALATR